MDRFDFSPVVRAPAPQMVPDQRPTADAAALARDPRPEVPLTIAAPAVPAARLSQVAEVTRSALRAEAPSATDPSLPLDKRLREVPRTLKPYGVSMLPDTRMAQKAEAAEQQADAAEATATRARSEATEARASATRQESAADAPPETAATRPEPAARPEPAVPRDDSSSRPVALAPDTARAAPPPPAAPQAPDPTTTQS